MRLVIDTHVMISGLLWHGAPHRLIEQTHSGAVSVVSSPALLEELAEVLAREKFADILARSGYTAARLLEDLQRMVHLVTPPPLPAPICRAPHDDTVLAVAFAAQADLIVSGDDDLLALPSFQGIPIVGSAEALSFCSKR
ncbi:putative toxin-antitoxin system toxin component, PIN family [Methylococcus sp. Mc7]|uniref:putative toxin-antitoxin system toxin component, PIN family n=1 Tax=Methylococcus sp. Mc7 TaxID=2860258 RepID=UPI001C532912|nr:putative toxin-antitoxin system toxin component, PIN family [Methylococcus sp. Mc7]QXP84945.1 putative toxin-antitoxin system toxin component, PIN family [Methylococcus sp. Mc7]